MSSIAGISDDKRPRPVGPAGWVEPVLEMPQLPTIHSGPDQLAATICRSLPGVSLIDRVLLRSIAQRIRRDVVSVAGMEHVAPVRDPFIFVANHSTRRESVHVPALLALHREGRLVHWFGDWNFRLIPGVNFVYRQAKIVTVSRKPARPRFLNRLKPHFADPLGPLRRARLHLDEGRSVGLFPEGTVNRDPDTLLAGHRGAAWLSLKTGAPIVPAGIVVSTEDGRKQLAIRVGAPIVPPSGNDIRVTRPLLRAWHATMMREIECLSGKRWDFDETSLPLLSAYCGRVAA